MKYKYLTVFLALFTSNVWAASFEELMVFPGDNVHSKSLEDYANMWWQWTYTMSKEDSPVRDRTGENCHIGQKGNVWFLAGGYGTSKISRECVIPEGKHIFFPVINMVYYPGKNRSLSCEDAKSAAALNNDELLSIEITVDSLISSNPNHTRISSEECFDLLGLIPKEYNAPRIYPAATDGFWIMLKPLSKGEHLLKFNAQYDRDKGGYSKMAQDIEYKIIIK